MTKQFQKDQTSMSIPTVDGNNFASAQGILKTKMQESVPRTPNFNVGDL